MAFTFEEEKNRFVIYTDDNKEAGEITWSDAGAEMMIVDHTFVDSAYRGNQLAQQLVLHVVEKARKENKKIIPLCPFAKKEFTEKPEYGDVWRK